ncbi:DUF4382 domain-containing protein [Piscinibacter terrae]|uniref:DUF4382 domain-containing protein n=1 Tax=Piscinibacter terrae TaxID=2496871 RepID=A0A3N7HS96_9BURK|nr:DUF4382 domain-containing protein [Albitalea terrae]RQP25140.1 DUF4382 domain-containing protein [Albitalea terrae]
MSFLQAWRSRGAALAASCLLLLSACGGGGSSGDGGGVTPTPGGPLGSLSIGITGGVPTGTQHVWVTIDSIALHADPDQPWSVNDSSWKVIRLDAPKTIDLAASVNGVLTRIITGQAVAAGDYAQIRLFLSRHDDVLTDAAKTAKLSWNTQVDYLDAAGMLRQVPLEVYGNQLGIRAGGSFNVSATVSTDLTFQLDVSKTLVRVASDDGVDRFIARPELRVYDIAKTGAIIGILDKSVFCTGGATTGCVYDAMVTAQRPSDDGLTMVSVRSTPVVMGDTYAAFALYPLPALPAGQGFDVVIHGRNMRTMVVKAVPAAADDLLAANPTQLGVDLSDPNHPVPAPLVPQLSTAGDAMVTLASPTIPKSASLRFSQTLPGTGELPHEIVSANVDAFSGLFAKPVPVPTGPLRVATYTNGSALAFSDVTPVEGSDQYTLTTAGTRYDFERSGVVGVAGGSTTAVTPTSTSRRAGLNPVSTAITVTVPSSKYDAAELVISDVGGVVHTQDVAVNSSGTTVSVDLPAGTYASQLGGTAVYSVFVRAWKRSSPSTTLQWAHAASVVDLRSAASASTSVNVP